LHEYFGLLKVAYDNVTLASGQSIRIDFGPNDVNDTTRDGNATTSPDVYGKYWNNMSWPNASAAPAANTSNVVPNGLAASGLLTTTNVATTTAVTMNGTSWLTNGLTTGGLLAPTFANLNDFAIATATQDYFFIQNGTTGGTLTLSGLDPYRLYDLKFFGTRNATEVRKTTYTVTGSNGVQTAELQTSGTGLGAGGYNGNNNTIVTIAGSQPTTAGTLQIKVSGTQVNFGYLAFLEITGSTPVTPPPPPPPAEVSRWLAQDAADPVVPNSVLFIGSSTIRRWESLTYDFADYNVIQRGWGGAWLSGVNDYASWVVDPYNPSAIVLWAGTNDITGGKTPQQLLTDFRTFVTREHADSPSTDILYISMTPTPGNGATDAARRQANALIAAETHTDPKLHFIDVATYFENLQVSDPAAFTALYVDSLHLSPSGYATWVSMVRPALAAVVPPNKSVVANPSTLQPGEKLLFDFGPSNVADGDPTGTDTLGNRWNNWVPTSGGGLVNIGEHIAGLVDTTGRNTGLKMKITGGFQVNGKNNGGLFAPNGPNAALLGDLAVQTATEDYFYSSADGKWDGGNDDLPGGFMIEGLDPALQYEFRFFGSRATTEVRVTEYSVRGANSGAANLQTSGAGMGSNGIYNGNDSGVAVVSGIRPDAFGQVFIDVTLIQGSYTHLNAMELLATTP
jgi:lysophospholipase L1-like esterase